MRLAVDLYGVMVGTLQGDARTFDFEPDAQGMEHFGPNNTVLSVAIPLTARQRRDHANRRRNWFSELLPEGDQYDHMLQQGGLRPGDTPGFLARYGRDVAGAVQIWDLDDPTEPKRPALAPLTKRGVRRLLEDPVGAPLGNDPAAGKTSLGGVQPKIALVRTTDGWAQALGGYPTTHILKPQLTGRLASVIFDEEYGSRIARRLGLSAFDTSIERFDGVSALVIERYDRLDGERVHQEDFSQALGAGGNQKYQELGGVVSLKRIAETITRHATDADLARLARMVVLAAGIGNLDMHAKNLGLLHFADGRIELAPTYDMVPQAHQRNDGKLALAVNGKYVHRDITKHDLAAELGGWGLRRADDLVDGMLDDLENALRAESPLDRAHPGLQDEVTRFVRNLRRGKAAGDRAR